MSRRHSVPVESVSNRCQSRSLLSLPCYPIPNLHGHHGRPAHSHPFGPDRRQSFSGPVPDQILAPGVGCRRVLSRCPRGRKIVSSQSRNEERGTRRKGRSVRSECGNRHPKSTRSGRRSMLCYDSQNLQSDRRPVAAQTQPIPTRYPSSQSRCGHSAGVIGGGQALSGKSTSERAPVINRASRQSLGLAGSAGGTRPHQLGLAAPTSSWN